MKENEIIIAIVLVLVVIGGGAGAYFMFGGQQISTDTAAEVRQRLVDQLPKSETETQLDNTAGDAHDSLYLANMIAYHQGAVNMAKLAQTKAEREELKIMAKNIVSTQTTETNNMIGWQKEWGYPSTIGENMVDHSAMGVLQDMNILVRELDAKKNGEEFEKAFLKTMIAHHELAIAMSRPASKNAKHQEIKDVTKSIIESQSDIITQMRQWQADWGYDK